MNIYARFFDRDILAHSVDELADFLRAIPDIRVTSDMLNDIRAYAESDLPYPKRYKIRPRVYFIMIKTTAETMEEFRANRNKGGAEEDVSAGNVAPDDATGRKELRAAALAEPRAGWYSASVLFKRVLLIPGTGKFQYQDTDFEVVLLAESAQDCYNRIITHLRNRPDVDMRSQFPSARGANFRYTYLGAELPEPPATA